MSESSSQPLVTLAQALDSGENSIALPSADEARSCALCCSFELGGEALDDGTDHFPEFIFIPKLTNTLLANTLVIRSEVMTMGKANEATRYSVTMNGDLLFSTKSERAARGSVVDAAVTAESGDLVSLWLTVIINDRTLYAGTDEDAAFAAYTAAARTSRYGDTIVMYAGDKKHLATIRVQA